MKLTSTDDVIELMDAYLPAAALGAAIERGLFWRLVDGPEPVDVLAAALDVPPRRCLHLCRLLAELGLLELDDHGVALSPVARSEIVETFTPEGWAVYASDLLEAYPVGLELSTNLGHPGSLWTLVEPGGRDHRADPAEIRDRHRAAVSYVHRMADDPERAEAFCRLLFDVHRPMAAHLADTLDLHGVDRLMDLGGGSGVVSFALLKRHQHLRAVVVDIATVCEAGRRIADEESVGDRITYHPADFTTDDLPTGFGMVLLCDVGHYGRPLFAKVASVLEPGGRFFIVHRLIDNGRAFALSDLVWGFRESLNDPEFAFTTVDQIVTDLAATGFEIESVGAMPNGAARITAVRAGARPRDAQARPS